MQRQVTEPDDRDLFKDFDHLEAQDPRHRCTLDPAVAIKMLRGAVMADRSVDLVQLRHQLPTITGQILLRRVFGTIVPDMVHKGEHKVSGGILPYRITHIIVTS